MGLRLIVIATAAFVLIVGSARASPETKMILLINAERSDHGLHRLHPNVHLRRSARSHSRDMVRRHYFDHRHFKDRILHSGYVNKKWKAGENIAWATGGVDCQLIFNHWMTSPPHRKNILDPSFKHIGVGIVRGTPERKSGYTYTTHFGTK